MRNPQRIYDFCNKLAVIWHDNCSDWRFGQLISNVFGAYAAKNKRDIFFPEDEELMSFMEQYFEVQPDEQN